MRKVLNKKFSGPSKLVGKVFQRHSGQNCCNVDSKDLRMTEDPSCLIKEMEFLRNQIDRLSAALNSCRIDTENKETKLAKLAREKEKLSLNLAKIKRSNENLAQQLEDERNFYYKEKETYCYEMNEYKKLKRVLSNSSVVSPTENKGEVEKLKKTLEQTLQINYNLGVKFLRMKETKNYLSNTLNKMEEEHRKAVNDVKIKIDNLKELKEILNDKFDATLSPSHKKYLQLMNQNSSLVYENLYLQMQVDELSLRLKRSKLQGTKSETTSRIQPNCEAKMKRGKHSSEIIKIFEKDERPDIPTVTILNEKEVPLRLHSSQKKLHLPEINESKLEVFQVSGFQSRSSSVSELSGIRRRTRSAPKIVQSVTSTSTRE